MTDVELNALARRVGENLKIEPSHDPQGEDDDYPGECRFCGEQQDGINEPTFACYPRILHDLNEAWKVAVKLDTHIFLIELREDTRDFVLVAGTTIKEDIEEVFERSNVPSLCLAIVRAAAKVLGIEGEK